MIKITTFLLLVSVSAIAQNFVYADTCAGSDIGAKIMSCRNSLPLANGYHVGTIILPNTAAETSLQQWSTAVILGPGVNLTGQGLFASSFSCTVSNGDCLAYDASGSGGTNAHTVYPNTVYQGFAITGSSTSPPLNIFDFKDAQGVTLRDIAADGAYMGTGACFLLQNINWWTERNLFENVSTLYNCNIGFRFTVVGSHTSFGYNRLLDVQTNPVADQNNPVTGSHTWSQTAFSFESSSYFYNSTFRATVNVGLGNPGATGAKVIHMQDTAKVYLSPHYS